MVSPTTVEEVWVHADDVARLARQLCRHREDAEDVAQSSLLKAAEHIDDFRGEATMRTWLHRITTNECRMLRRRLVARSLDDILEHAPPDVVIPATFSEASPEDLAEEHVLAESVLGAVSTLPERQRAVLILLEGAGLEVPEVARRLGTSVAAVRSLLARARRTLRASVQPAPFRERQ